MIRCNLHTIVGMKIKTARQCNSQKRTIPSAAIAAVCPMFRAQCHGRSPALLEAFTLAPRLTSRSMPSVHPSYAALCSGVLPAASTSFTLSPASTSATISEKQRRSCMCYSINLMRLVPQRYAASDVARLEHAPTS